MSKLTLPFLNLFLYLLITSIPFLVISQNVDTELDILLKLKQQLGNPLSLQSWTSSSLPCSWTEISCADGKVTNLLLSNKDISVEIPATICDLTTSPFLTCPLTTSPEDFQELFSTAQSYKVLVSEFNQFNGTFPKEIGNLANLVELGLAYNGFLPSTIPVEFGKLSKLTFMWIRYANLIGPIPDSFANLSSLEHLDLAVNNLEGSIPDGFFVEEFDQLYLFRNKLSGEIPQKVEALNLVEIDLAMNNLNGSIPEDFGKLQNLKLLSLFTNQLSGELPSSLAWNLSSGSDQPTSSTALFLDGNQFSGQLPTKIISWKSLTTLNLSRNALSGQIPTVMGSLPSLSYLDLSQNHFSGKIPSELGQLKLLELNLSSNQLFGQIPDQFDNLAYYENSFLNNSNLCAVNPALNLPNCYIRPRSSKKLSSKFLAMILVLAIAIFIGAAILTLLAFRDYQRKKQKRDLATWKLTSFQKVDFTEANILASLTENNLIGSGGSGKVYRIVVNHAGEFVAAKRIWNSKAFDESSRKNLWRRFKSWAQLGTQI
ncbi:hypothetical protein GH714_000232 [Hevea brasiliensis]|uniref:Leucine-rich repeat-containing N-terminal plant-type domain-containing protein n=1 Tax=Hevea brasiliensis TaxID=3981 RepID=A0A6A6KAD2_HEVBR|nr:hypothetical protein GH714_000232 [Hevea brasiliensis]